MNRQQKKEFVAQLRHDLLGSTLVVVTRQVGMTVEDVTHLRRQMRAANARYKVTKNTLATLAVQDTPLAELSTHFVGPVALAYSTDPIAAAKVAVEYAGKVDKMTIVAGMLDGRLMSASDVKALAALPSLDELRAKLLGVLVAPATKIAGVLQAPAGQLARVFSAYASK